MPILLNSSAGGDYIIPNDVATYKRFLFEVENYTWKSNCVAVDEVQVFDADNNLIPFTMEPGYIFENGRGVPYYWYYEFWNWTGLVNGDTSHHQYSSAIFLYEYAVGWARFQGYVPKGANVASVAVHINGGGRKPDWVNVYQILHDDISRYFNGNKLIDYGLFHLAKFEQSSTLPVALRPPAI